MKFDWEDLVYHCAVVRSAPPKRDWHHLSPEWLELYYKSKRYIEKFRNKRTMSDDARQILSDYDAGAGIFKRGRGKPPRSTFKGYQTRIIEFMLDRATTQGISEKEAAAEVADRFTDWVDEAKVFAIARRRKRRR